MCTQLSPFPVHSTQSSSSISFFSSSSNHLNNSFKKKQANRCNFTAIASNYGEGASENGGTPTKTKKPRAKATPKKKVKKEEAGGDDDDLEGGSDIELQTPTKGPLNKTMGGRVMKQQRTPRKTAPMNLAEDTSEDEDGAMIKYEGSGDSQHYSHAGSFNNGNGYHNGHSNGNGNGYITEGYGDSFHNVDDGDMYYAAEDGYGGGDDEVV